jgi:hypothetical protein
MSSEQACVDNVRTAGFSPLQLPSQFRSPNRPAEASVSITNYHFSILNFQSFSEKPRTHEVLSIPAHLRNNAFWLSHIRDICASRLSY